MTEQEVKIYPSQPQVGTEQIPVSSSRNVPDSTNPEKDPKKKKIIIIVCVSIAAALVIVLVALLSYYGTRKESFLIPIISTNDIHGYFYERNYKTLDNVNYTIGGLQFFESYVRLLREEFGPEGSLYLDGGDQYQGAVESQETNNGSIIAEFMNIVKPNATTIGNHEYDYDIELLKNRIRLAWYPFLACNVYDKTTNSQTPFGTNQLTSKVFNMTTKKGKKVKIGVIGLSYDMSVKTISGQGFEDIGFTPYVEAIEAEAKKIRDKQSVEAMVLLSHIGLSCGSNLSYANYTKDSKQQECDDSTELYEVLTTIKPGTIDAVISADTHYEVHHWINGIPVISGINNGQYTNIMYLPFEKKGFSKKYKLKNESIFIEGALPICDKVFENTKQCEKVANSSGLGKLIELTFHGKNLEASDQVKELWDYYLDVYERNNVHVFYMYGPFDIQYGGRENLNGDNHFGNMICDFLQEKLNTDFSVINPGGFRTYWAPGSITAADIKSMFPFDNDLCISTFTGKQIIDIFKTVHYGEKHKGPYNTAGLKHTSDGSEVIKVEMYDRNGELKQINETATYKLGSINFILKSYGDDFASVESILEKGNPDCSFGDFSSTLTAWLKSKGELQMTDFYNENKRRFIVTSS